MSNRNFKELLISRTRSNVDDPILYVDTRMKVTCIISYVVWSEVYPSITESLQKRHLSYIFFHNQDIKFLGSLPLQV